jgi:dihydrolipoamide dehydrogenase
MHWGFEGEQAIWAVLLNRKLPVAATRERLIYNHLFAFQPLFTQGSTALPDTIYDVAIIGSGPGGYTAAFRAGQLGLKAALIEKDSKLGGTCLHVGCIPTKALLFNAEVYDHLKSAEKYGIDGLGAGKLNWKNIQDRKNQIVAKHTKGLDFLVRKNKVTAVRGYGQLTGPAKNGIHTVDVTDDAGKKSQVQAKNLILATGSYARMLPGLQPDERILTNIEVLSLGAIPKSMVIIGSGAVGVEFASIYRSFGAEVTVIEMLPRLVPVEDEEVSKELLRSFKKKGINCFVNTKVEKVEKTKDGVTVTFTPQGELHKSSRPKKFWWPSAVARTPRSLALRSCPTSRPNAAMFTLTNGSEPVRRESLQSATLWPDIRNWRTRPPWRALWR